MTCVVCILSLGNVMGHFPQPMSIEDTYQKKTQLEHILLRPDTYVGSIERTRQECWVFDGGRKFTSRTIEFVPGLYKIFDEILVNAADNKQRDPSMSLIDVEINPDTGRISVWNDGHGIPIQVLLSLVSLPISPYFLT